MADIDWDAVFDAAGQRYNIDPRVLKRLGGHESGNNPNSRPGPATQYSNGEQAQGQMQVLPSTGREMGYDVRDPIQNIFASAAYLRKGLDETGNLPDAVRYYHGGPNRAIWGQEGEKEVRAILGGYQGVRLNPGAQGGGQPQGAVNNVAETVMPWEQPSNRSNNRNTSKMPWEETPTSNETNPRRSFMELLKDKIQPAAPQEVAPAPQTAAEAPASPAAVPAPAASPEPTATVNPLQAGITGAANGALFGYGPQVMGAAASINPLTNETYQQARDRAMARINQAQQQHPYAYTAGDIGGNMLTATVPFAGEGALAGKLAGVGVSYMPLTVARGLIGGAEGALNASSNPNATPGSVAAGAATGAVGSAIAPAILEKVGEGTGWVFDKTTGRLMRLVGGGDRNVGTATSLVGAGAGAAGASGLLGAVPYVGSALDTALGGPLGQALGPVMGATAATDLSGRIASAALKGTNSNAGRGALNALTGRGPQDVNMLQSVAAQPKLRVDALDGLYDQNLAVAAHKIFGKNGKVDPLEVAKLLRNADPHDQLMIKKAFGDRIDALAGSSP